jgi:hypothetical protein
MEQGEENLFFSIDWMRFLILASPPASCDRETGVCPLNRLPMCDCHYNIEGGNTLSGGYT